MDLHISEFPCGAKEKKETFLSKIGNYKKSLFIPVLLFAMSGLSDEAIAKQQMSLEYTGNGQGSIYSYENGGDFYIDKSGNNLGMAHPKTDIKKKYTFFPTTRINADNTIDRFMVSITKSGEEHIHHVAKAAPKTIEFINPYTKEKDTATFLIEVGHDKYDEAILTKLLTMMAETKVNYDKFASNKALYGEEIFTAYPSLEYSGTDVGAVYYQFDGMVRLIDPKICLDFSEKPHNNQVELGNDLKANKETLFMMFSYLSHEYAGHSRVLYADEFRDKTLQIDEAHARVKQFRAEQEYVQNNPDYKITGYSYVLNLAYEKNKDLNLSDKDMDLLLIIADLHVGFYTRDYDIKDQFPNKEDFIQDVKDFGAEHLAVLNHKDLRNLNFHIQSDRLYEKRTEEVFSSIFDDATSDKYPDKYVRIYDKETGKSFKINACKIFDPEKSGAKQFAKIVNKNNVNISRLKKAHERN